MQMVLKKVFIFQVCILIKLVSVIPVQSDNDYVCPKEVHYINGSKYTWWKVKLKNSVKSKLAISEPPCIDENKEIVYRNCTREGWIPQNPPDCIHVKKNVYCPNSLEEIQLRDDEFLCVKVSSREQSWKENYCFGSDKMIFDLNSREREAVLNYLLQNYNITRFWLPASRVGDSTGDSSGYDAFSPLLWRLPGKEWGEEVSEDYDDTSKRNCAVASVMDESEIHIEMVDCINSKFRSVCIFEKNLFIESNCPKNYAALSYKPEFCYGFNLAYESTDYTDLDYLNIVSNDNIFQRFMNFYVKEMENTHKTSKKFEPKCRFKIIEDLPIKTFFSTLAFNSSGKITSEEKGNCYLNIRHLKKKKPVQMFISFNSKRDSLMLTVYNMKDIWRENPKDDGIRCFTNADYDQIRSIKIKDILFDKDNRTLFEMKLYGDGPGYYWCEAHTIYNFEFIQSQKVIASKKNKGHPFAMFFDIPCDVENCHEINKNMKHYGKRVEKTLNELKERREVRKKFKSLVIHNVRIMKVESLVPEKSLKVLCHVTITMKSSSVDNKSSSEEDDGENNNSRLEENGVRHDIWIRFKLKKLLESLLRTSNYPSTVNSTEFCFPELFKSESTNRWRPARIGVTTTTFEMCLTSNGLPVTRKCIGDFIYGAVWEPIDPNIQGITNPKENIITKDLFQIESNFELILREPTKIVHSLKNIMKNVEKLIPADLYYLGSIMNTVASTILANFDEFNTITANVENDFNNNTTEESYSTTTAITPSLSTTTQLDVIKSSGDIVAIYCNLMSANINVIKPSIKLNSTNILLEAFETIIDRAVATSIVDDDYQLVQEMMKGNTGNFFVDNDNGVSYYFSSKLLVFIINPNVSNISGVALFTNQSKYNNDDEPDFNYSYHRFIQSNQSIFEFSLEDELEVATFAPKSLLDQLHDPTIWTNNNSTPSPPPLKIVIKIYINDHLFQEDRDVTDKKVFSKIISISIPGYERELLETFPILMRSHSPSDENKTDNSWCRYWNYSTWADDGLTFQYSLSDNYILCGFSHLTPFAYLVGGSYNLTVATDIVIITSIHQEALDIITLLGCSLSLIGIIGIFITAVTFRSWREKPSSKVLLQLSCAIALQMILFCFVNTEVLTSHLIENEIYSSCIALGAFLHYSVLVQFSWMLIIAFLQYKRYVQVIGNSRPTRFFAKTFIFGWGLPLVPVILVLTINRNAYIPFEDADNSKICYPGGQALYMAVMLPIALIIIANLFVFIVIIHNIVRSTDGKVRQNDRKLAVRQVRLSILLFFLLGFTWIFGILAAFKAGILFSYLFCLTATLQGFVLFIYFVILDPLTRKMWSNVIQEFWNDRNVKSVGI